MKFIVEHKYILLPVNADASLKKICLFENNELLFDFDCRVDALTPNFTAYVDVSRFMGKTVELAISPQMDFGLRFSDEKELAGLWQEPRRPKIHFTVQNGYNNDPNGLIYHKGTYHMFYQHNPCAAKWGNMHWGHAESADLLHWEEKDCALFPDETGTMFSGSAIADTFDRSGLKQGEPAMLLFYTAAGDENLLSKGKRFTQCLAYSVDDGKTFEKYAANPVIDFICDKNRDPKVVWVEEIERYILALYLSGDEYQMFSSEDLLHWRPFQALHLPGDSECPDIYPLVCDGEKKWILSGASDHYVVGHFEKDRFCLDSAECQALTYSSVSYAAQSFSGLKDGRIVRIAWDRNWTRFLDARFSQQMGFPVEMHLEKSGGRYYLAALPIAEIACLFGKELCLQNQTAAEAVRWEVGAGALYICLQAPYAPNAMIEITVFDAKIVIDTRQNKLKFGDREMPLSVSCERIDVRLLVDTCSIEFFADQGKFCMTEWHIQDFNLPYVEIKTSGEAVLERFSCRQLKSIHEEKSR